MDLPLLENAVIPRVCSLLGPRLRKVSKRLLHKSHHSFPSVAVSQMGIFSICAVWPSSCSTWASHLDLSAYPRTVVCECETGPTELVWQSKGRYNLFLFHVCSKFVCVCPTPSMWKKNRNRSTIWSGWWKPAAQAPWGCPLGVPLEGGCSSVVRLRCYCFTLNQRVLLIVSQEAYMLMVLGVSKLSKYSLMNIWC